MTTSSPEAAVAALDLPDLRAPAPGLAAAAGDPVAEAYAQGLADGRAAAEAAARAETAAVTAQLQEACAAAVQGLEEAGHALQRVAARSVPAVAVAIARHLVDRAYEADPLVLQPLVTRALEMLPLRGPVTVRLNPQDLATLQAADALPPSPDSCELRWLADAELGRGSLMVDTTTSILDGRIDRVLLDLYEQLSRD